MVYYKYNNFFMLQAFIQSLLPKAVYTQEKDWWYIVDIPWYQWFFSQWDTMEEARENLIDAIEWVIILKLIDWDQDIKNEFKSFLENNKKWEYA